MPRIVIIGAGISGLATAYHLQTLLPAAEITVVEAADRPGGTIWTERRAGCQFELGPNGFLDTKRSTLELCERLGMRSELVLAGDAAKHRFLFRGERLERLPEGPGSFLFTPLVGRRSKWAVLTERFRKAPPPAPDESVHDFIARRTTAEIAETFGDALVTGIYAGDPKLLSMAAAFPHIVAMERGHGSVTTGLKQAARQRRAEAAARGEPYERVSRLISLRWGLRRLIENLCDGLRRPPILGVPVRRILRTDDGVWQTHADGRAAWPAEVVVLACPAYRQAELVVDLDRELAELMRQILYAPVAVVALGYRTSDVPISLDGFGYIAPQRLKRDVLGVQWCSSIFPNRAPAGHVLLRALAGGWNRPDVVAWNDDHLLAAVRAELKLAMGIEAAPVFHHTVRWERAIPQYHLGHLERVARIESLAARHEGLHLTGNAYHGVSLNDCTEQAELLARRIASV